MSSKVSSKVQVFHTEADCLQHLKKSPSQRLFSGDISSSLSKCFISASYNQIYKVSLPKNNYFYENFDRDTPLKLFLDLDIKSPQSEFNLILNDALCLVNCALQKFKIHDPSIIVLTSHRKHKSSAHVIYPNVHFANVYYMRDFMSELKSDLIDDGILDMNVYRKGCFRMLWNSKYGVNVPLEYSHGLNYEHKSDHKLFMDCLLTNVSANSTLIPMPEHKKILPKQAFHSITRSGSTIPELSDYLAMLSMNRCNDYTSWIKVGMILKCCNSESFDLWDDWSKKSASYSSRESNYKKWQSFKRCNFTVASLRLCAKQDSPENFKRVSSRELKLPNSVEFSGNYLLNEESESIKSAKSFISKFIIKWLSSNQKTLIIKSPYDTGKTSLISTLVKEFGIRRILFVSYRQTLTNDLHGTFSDLKVESYLDGQYEGDRQICQIESLFRLDQENSQTGIPEYDLVILDEMESILNHFNSSTVKDKEDTYNLLRCILHNSSKILAMDGDLDIRSTDYLKQFGEYVVVHNTIKKNRKKFIFTKDESKFDQAIESDLSSGKNIALVCLSYKMANHYSTKYGLKFKTLLHSSKSDDILKSKLKSVNTFWVEYSFLVYTPTVEAGVNFHVDHFDKIYGLIGSKSTSPRGFMQMLARIRKVKSCEILVYMRNLSPKVGLTLFTYDDVKEYVNVLLEKYLRPRYEYLDDKFCKVYSNPSYETTIIHNVVECMNKSCGLFMSTLVYLLEAKGHEWEFAPDIMKDELKVLDDGSKSPDEVMYSELINAKDIPSEMYTRLLSKQKKNRASRVEKMQIERYLIMKYWNLEKLTMSFLETYYGKTHVLFNLRSILKESEPLKVSYTKKKEAEKKVLKVDGNKKGKAKTPSTLLSKVSVKGDSTKLPSKVSVKGNSIKLPSKVSVKGNSSKFPSKVSMKDDLTNAPSKVSVQGSSTDPVLLPLTVYPLNGPFSYTLNESKVVPMDFGLAKRREKRSVVIDLVTNLGFVIGCDVVLSEREFIEGLKRMAKDSLLFTESHTEKLFNFYKMKVKGLKSVRSYMGFVNSFLKEYGLMVWRCYQKNMRIKNGTTTVFKKINYYGLSYWKDIDKYIDFKVESGFNFVDDMNDIQTDIIGEVPLIASITSDPPIGLVYFVDNDEENSVVSDQEICSVDFVDSDEDIGPVDFVDSDEE